MTQAPEVALSKMSSRSDMWALGCVALELISRMTMRQRCDDNNTILGVMSADALKAFLDEVLDDTNTHIRPLC